jgi:hypothetical protein
MRIDVKALGAMHIMLKSVSRHERQKPSIMKILILEEAIGLPTQAWT